MLPGASAIYTLRKHECEVTCLKVVHLNAFPMLVSGDRNGLIIIWDLIARRPRFQHQLESKAHIVSIGYLDHYITLLSKDHTLRFLCWCKNNCVVLTGQDHDDTNECEGLHQVYEIPVNTLNFANVALTPAEDGLHRLWCCHTVDSESFDVYTFNLQDPHSLKRQFNRVNLYDALLSATNWKRDNALEKTGIVMKFLEHKGVVFLGFESGFVVGVQLLETPNSQPVLALVYASSIHYPEPVLSLCVSSDGRSVYSSSTNSVIGIHNLSSVAELSIESKIIGGVAIPNELSLSKNALKMQSSEIAHLESIANCLIATNWKGQTLISNNSQTIVANAKERSNVLVEVSNAGSFSEEKKTQNWIKVSSMTCLERQKPNSIECFNAGQKRRIETFASRNWIFTGYEDGSIVMQSFDT
ncbi:LADA_0C03686g1_1 [Lachancea dasiensis]|uniref:LADA_0C03686g1_1 n=1 Tax=Lachancea dasiensis TaxID=1072105 RepID=A0A1G4IYI1_9SACH|nr:LADA_0C03686g1_1 [Lachancea dasiensis]